MIKWITALIFSLLIHILIVFSYSFFQEIASPEVDRKIAAVKFLPPKNDEVIPQKKTIQTSKKTQQPITKKEVKIKEEETFDFSEYLDEEILQKLDEENIDLIEEISSKVISDLQRIWIKPNNIPAGVYAEFELELDRLGNIRSMNLKRSSGIGAFDRAAQNAIRKYNRIKYIAEIDDSLYSSYFAKFTLRFRPK